MGQLKGGGEGTSETDKKDKDWRTPKSRASKSNTAVNKVLSKREIKRKFGPKKE
jgi:hypothetical protein